MIEVTHMCPPGDSDLTPCCGRTPFELPMTDRMTLQHRLVTCSVGAPVKLEPHVERALTSGELLGHMVDNETGLRARLRSGTGLLMEAASFGFTESDFESRRATCKACGVEAAIGERLDFDHAPGCLVLRIKEWLP